MSVRPKWDTPSHDCHRPTGVVGSHRRDHLDRGDAADIIENTVTVIRDRWGDAGDAARLTRLQRDQLWARQILNPFIFDDRSA